MSAQWIVPHVDRSRFSAEPTSRRSDCCAAQERQRCGSGDAASGLLGDGGNGPSRTRRRFTRTTDSDHDQPIFPFVVRDFELHGPDLIWAKDLTCFAIANGFGLFAVILKVRRRRIVG